MTSVSSRGRVAMNEAGFFAAILAIVGLSLVQWGYASSDAPDWQGYETLYEGTADWLTPNGLAPLFVAFLSGARWLFGPEGYGLFRLSLFAVFAGFAGCLAYMMPLQRRLGGASALVTSGAVITALLLKSVVQIREGLAFIILLVGILALLRHNIARFIGPGASVALAPLVHAGVAPLSSVWLIACALAWVPCKILTSRWLRESIGLIALTVGLSLAAAVIANGDPIGVYIAGLGVETSAIAQGGPIKIGYWGALGVVMLVLGRQVSVCEGKLALAFSILLGVGLIPLSYGLCLGLVMANFRIPAVTSIAIRVLITGLDLALVMICLRGRANMLTAGAMLFMLADELRLLATA